MRGTRNVLRRTLEALTKGEGGPPSLGEAMPAQLFRSTSGQLRGKWRRRESNPRSEQLATDSEEDPDLANADASETASEPSHKQVNPDRLPFIDPGQFSVFDFLNGSNDAKA